MIDLAKTNNFHHTMWGQKVNTGLREGASSEVDKLTVFRRSHQSENIPHQRCYTIQIQRKQICSSYAGMQMAILEKQ